MLLPLVVAFSFLLGPEIESSTPVIEPAHTAWSPAIATDGRDYLVQWRDQRGGTRVTRVTSDGTVVSRAGIPLTRFGLLGWNGDDYVIISKPFSDPFELTRLDRDGNLIDATPQKGALIFNVMRYIVSGSRTLVVSYGAPRLATVLGPEGDLIRSVPLPEPIPVAYGSNAGAFVVLSQGNDGALFLTRISREGQLLDPAPLEIGNSPPGFFGIASDGDGWLIVRVEYGVNTPPHTAHVMALSAAGAPRGGVTTIALPDSRSVSSWGVVWSGSAYLFACAAMPDSSVWRATLGRNGELLSPPSEVAPSGAEDIALESNGSSALLVWATAPNFVVSDTVMTPTVMTAQIFDADGAPSGTSFPVTWSAPPQTRQEIAWDGRELLAVWCEAAGLFMGHLTPDGTPMDGRGVRLAPSAGEALPFAVAFDGRRFVVVWREGTTVFARRVAPDGIADETMVLGASDYPAEITLACDGNGGCLVAWMDYGVIRGGLLRDVFLAIQGLPAGPNVIGPPAVAFDGREYLLTFTAVVPPPPPCARNCFPTGVDLLRVSADGRVIDPLPVNIGEGWTPEIAWRGENGLLVWDRGDLVAAPIDRDLHVFAALPIDPTSVREHHVVTDGEAFLVASWEADAGQPLRWRLTIVAPDGRAGQSVLLDAGARNARVVAAGSGHAIVTYVRSDNDGVSRAFTRLVTDLGGGPVRARVVRH